MVRSGFQKQTLEQVKAKQAVKRAKKLATPPAKRAKRPLGASKTKKTVKGTVKVKTQAQLKKMLWALCKEVIRKRDGTNCIVCGKTGLSGSGWHTGHFIPRSTCGALLRYDIRNLHSSCYYCNINLGGNGAIYLRSLVRIYGQEFVDNIFEDKKKYTKDDAILLQRKINEYEQIRSWSKVELFNYTGDYKTT